MKPRAQGPRPARAGRQTPIERLAQDEVPDCLSTSGKKTRAGVSVGVGARVLVEVGVAVGVTLASSVAEGVGVAVGVQVAGAVGTGAMPDHSLFVSSLSVTSE